MILRPVLDCSMAMSWCFEDEKTPQSEQTYQGILALGAAVPCWFFLEIANAVVVAERGRRLTAQRASEFLDMISSLDLTILDEVLPDRLPEILALARKHQLSAYDAMYLDLAKEIGATIASLDRPLLAAGAREGVQAFDPGNT